jgi:type III secretory pathway component EscT
VRLDLLGEAGPQLAAVLLHALRLLPAAVASPFLGGPLVPPFVRVGLAFGLGASAWWAAGAPAGPAGAELARAALGEGALGIVLGFLAALPLEAARAAGRLADTLRGATLSELHVAALRQQETALGDLLVQWTIALAALAGGARLVVASLLGSFAALPAGAAWPDADLCAPVLQLAGELVSCALCVGAPAAAGVLAAELAVALALRAAPPALHGVAQPARAGLGIAALAIASAAVGGRLTSLVALSAASIGAATGSR